MSTPGVRPSPSLQDRPSSGRRAFVGMLAAGVALPLAVFYGLRAAGVNQWLALVLGPVTPAVRLAVTALRARASCPRRPRGNGNPTGRRGRAFVAPWAS